MVSAVSNAFTARETARALGRFVALSGYEFTDWIHGHRCVLWFGEDASCWLENTAAFLPMLGEDGALAPAAPESKERNRDHGPLHVPVVRPSDRPDGDRPPPIDEKPLPPI